MQAAALQIEMRQLRLVSPQLHFFPLYILDLFCSDGTQNLCFGAPCAQRLRACDIYVAKVRNAKKILELHC